MNNNIEETRVSFEVAKLLKEKGFKVQVNQGFYTDENSPDGKYYKDESFDVNYNSEPYTDKVYSRPTQQLVLDWLRVNFGVEILAMRNMNGNYTAHIYTGHKSINEGKDWEDMTILTGNTSEEAKEAALLYTLKKLIK